MKKWRGVGWASIACFCIVAIAIQAVFGGGMGLGIAPEKVVVAPGSTITYVITVYNYQDNPDLFDVSVLPESCDSGWFSWATNQTDIVPADRGQKRVLLDVTPTKKGNYTFKVRAVSKSDSGIYAFQTASISVNNTKKPDLIITDIWDVGTVVHYEIMNIGTATTTKSSKTALFVDGNFTMNDLVSTSLAPGESVEGDFKNYDWTTSCTSQHDVVIIKVCADNNDDIDELDESNNCKEEPFNCPSPPCIALTPDKSEPQIPGTVINWTACACDPEVEGCKLCYRFWLEGPGTGGNKIIMQNWSTNNTCRLSTIWADRGDSNIYVDAADCDHLIVLRTAVYRNYTIRVNDPPVCACLMPDKTAPLQLEEDNEENITWNASAFDPEGDTLEYRFLLSGPGTGHNFTVMQDWRNASYPECPTWTWTPVFPNDMGNNHIKVEFRDRQYFPPQDPNNYSDVNATYPKYWIGPAE